MKARAAVLEELLVLADEVLEARRTLFKCGLVSSNDLDMARVERSRIAACLARERGNREAELAALQGIVDDQSRRLERTRHSLEKGVVAHSEYETVDWEVKVAQVQLREAKARHEADDASREHRRLTLLEMQRATCWKLGEELEQAEHDLALRKSVHHEGASDGFAVFETAARYWLTKLSYRQCQLDLAQLQNDIGTPCFEPAGSQWEVRSVRQSTQCH